MTDILHVARKSRKQFFFEVKLNMQPDERITVRAHDVDGTLGVALSPKFGGEGKEWSPEHLFLSSLSSCFMTTFLLYAKKAEFNVSGFECNAIGQIEIQENRYQFTNVNLYPKIFIADEKLRNKTVSAIRKAQRNSLVGNSVSAVVVYHPQVFVGAIPSVETNKS